MRHTYRPRVLVVNDDPASLLALQTLLEQWTAVDGYDVITARSGDEALRHLLHREVAVILMDVNMPGMDGFETAEAIQSHPRLSHIPIIFVTAFQIDEVSRLRAYRYQAADFLFTPVIPQILKAKVAIFVSLAVKNELLRAQAEALGARTEELSLSNAKLSAEILDRQAAERENEAKDEFLAMLGHELRNPLSAVTSAAALLGMKALPHAAGERARTVIQRQTKQLRRIVDEILELSRIGSGKVSLQTAPVDLADIARECVDEIEATGRMSAHELTVDFASCHADVDTARIKQALTHLIENALSFTPTGGTVRISTLSDHDEVILCVEDTGIGLAPELLPRVFDVFVQGPRELDRTAGGLGIGLAMVKALVELHGGQATASSAGQGMGSTFAIRLPVHRSTQATPTVTNVTLD